MHFIFLCTFSPTKNFFLKKKEEYKTPADRNSSLRSSTKNCGERCLNIWKQYVKSLHSKNCSKWYSVYIRRLFIKFEIFECKIPSSFVNKKILSNVITLGKYSIWTKFVIKKVVFEKTKKLSIMTRLSC